MSIITTTTTTTIDKDQKANFSTIYPKNSNYLKKF